jgi:VIT1/CCC1 family predicted Fe2+/Mn2+ transporter
MGTSSFYGLAACVVCMASWSLRSAAIGDAPVGMVAWSLLAAFLTFGFAVLLGMWSGGRR